MALKIRLSRGGAKKRPFYRIVVTDSRSPRDGRFIERIGHYDPMLPKDHAQRIVLKDDRARHWLAQGAKPSDRVAGFLSAAALIEKPARADQTKQHLPRAKAQERMREAEAAKAAAAEAATKAAAEAEAAPAAEAEAAPAEAEAVTAEETSSDPAPAEAPAEDAAGGDGEKSA